MFNTKIKRVIGFVLLLTVAGGTLAFIPTARANNARANDARANDDNNVPVLPSPLCDSLQVPAGNEMTFHAYALGVQIYKWNGASWDFVAPEATLYADSNYRGKVGTHYAGPTWESNSGSNVVGKRLTGCSPDSTAIDWLRLQMVSTDGPGIFSQVTFIQRVNTVGGKAPATPGSSIGAEARVPYTAEYYFYRPAN